MIQALPPRLPLTILGCTGAATAMSCLHTRARTAAAVPITIVNPDIGHANTDTAIVANSQVLLLTPKIRYKCFQCNIIFLYLYVVKESRNKFNMVGWYNLPDDVQTRIYNHTDINVRFTLLLQGVSKVFSNFRSNVQLSHVNLTGQLPKPAA